MTGPVLFADVAKAGRTDVAAVAKALEIDAYKARLLLQARVPFLAQGFPSHGLARKAAEALAAMGIPASAHAEEEVRRVPAAVAAGAVARRGDAFVFATGGAPREIAFDALRALVHGKLTAKPDAAADSGGFGLDFPVLSGARRPPPATREPVHYWRLDVFAEPRAGECIRIAVRHDLFDYSCLAERKTLSSVRNLAALRDEISRARRGADVPVDGSFDKTDLARMAFLPDTYSELDVATRGQRTMSVQSNRAAFEEFAAVRFLHERSRVPEKADHYFEL